MTLRLLFLFSLLAPSGGACGQALLFGRVIDLDTGVALEGALATVHAPGAPPIARTRTDAAGRFLLRAVPAGTWVLDVAFFRGPVRFRVRAPAVPVAGTLTPLDVAVPTTPREWLGTPNPSPFRTKDLSDITGIPREGRVVDARGRPLPGVRTVIETRTVGTLAGVVWRTGVRVEGAVVSLDGLPTRTLTDAVGAFFLDDLAPGSYRLRVTTGSDTRQTIPLDVEAGLNTLSIDLAARR